MRNSGSETLSGYQTLVWISLSRTVGRTIISTRHDGDREMGRRAIGRYAGEASGAASRTAATTIARQAGGRVHARVAAQHLDSSIPMVVHEYTHSAMGVTRFRVVLPRAAHSSVAPQLE
eukprot:1587847-Pleurochrysis_carterae.AAC.1